jgi:hypothetical protein
MSITMCKHSTIALAQGTNFNHATSCGVQLKALPPPASTYCTAGYHSSSNNPWIWQPTAHGFSMYPDVFSCQSHHAWLFATLVSEQTWCLQSNNTSQHADQITDALDGYMTVAWAHSRMHDAHGIKQANGAHSPLCSPADAAKPGQEP